MPLIQGGSILAFRQRLEFPRGRNFLTPDEEGAAMVCTANRHRVRLDLAFAAFCLCGCAGSFNAYDSPRKSGSELAIIESDNAITKRFGYGVEQITAGGGVNMLGRVIYSSARDGKADTIRVQPGTYEIAYEYGENKHYLSGSAWVAEEQSFAELDLKPGHTYVVRGEKCDLSRFSARAFGPNGLCRSHSLNSIYLWIEDRTVGQVVDGTPW
jgi:hypothetical protein